MNKKKYALLDTDFISKMHLIRKDEQNKLIDKIMTMPDYIFYCHKQIGIELARHNIAGSPEWFEEKVAEQSGFTREDAEPYIKSYMNGCLGKNQKIFKVQDASKEKRVCKVPCEQVFDEMFNGKIEEMKNGNLKYI